MPLDQWRWVTPGGHWRKERTVHRFGCRYAVPDPLFGGMTTYGKKMKATDIDPSWHLCKVCHHDHG